MKNKEFIAFKFGAGQKVLYKGKEYDLVSVDFEEQLIGFIDETNNLSDTVTWVRCENCEII